MIDDNLFTSRLGRDVAPHWIHRVILVMALVISSASFFTKNGPSMEKTLMTWDRILAVATLSALPMSK